MWSKSVKYRLGSRSGYRNVEQMRQIASGKPSGTGLDRPGRLSNMRATGVGYIIGAGSRLSDAAFYKSTLIMVFEGALLGTLGCPRPTQSSKT